MMTAREVVLARIRAALADPNAMPEVPRTYRSEGEHRPGATELLDLLTNRLVDYKASVHRCPMAAVPEVIVGVLPRSARLIIPSGLTDGWAPPGAVTDDGNYDATALDSFDAVLTGCVAAVAETGTIALDGSDGQGRRAISLVPDRHVCVVRAETVVQTVPELLARLDPRRPITLVSGPSATSDIELQRVEGVHGPRTLIVIIATA
jgi:L-lactate dehydrogenase complex protein LldG